MEAYAIAKRALQGINFKCYKYAASDFADEDAYEEWQQNVINGQKKKKKKAFDEVLHNL